MSAIRAILTDIEGTTTAISFVKDVLFPFARDHLARFVAEHGAEATVRACLDESRALAGDPAMDDDAVVGVLLAWIDQDRKATPLKALQGLIWDGGYANGALLGHVYDDVPGQLRRWHGQGLDLYVYSSGSVQAQKLIYGHSTAGDLTPLFSGYFDTTTGPKSAVASYHAIAAAIGRAPGEILFLSDAVAELDAARAAGLATACLDRGAVVVPPGHGHPVFTDFTGIDRVITPAGEARHRV